MKKTSDKTAAAQPAAVSVETETPASSHMDMLMVRVASAESACQNLHDRLSHVLCTHYGEVFGSIPTEEQPTPESMEATIVSKLVRAKSLTEMSEAWLRYVLDGHSPTAEAAKSGEPAGSPTAILAMKVSDLLSSTASLYGEAASASMRLFGVPMDPLEPVMDESLNARESMALFPSMFHSLDTTMDLIESVHLLVDVL